MTNDVSLENIIRRHISLPARTNARGWYSVLCKVCNDHGRKGPRAGFRFTGNESAYHCFNCGIAGSYDPAEDENLSSSMKKVLAAYGITESEWQPVLYNAFVQRQQHGYVKTQRTSTTQLEPQEIQLPPFFEPLSENGSDIHEYAIQYLQARSVDWKSQPFYVCTTCTHPDAERWFCRVIIPVYKDGKLIFYQGRDLTDTRPRKYLSPNVPRDNLLYGFDNITKDTSEPLYITEGWFDAYAINGCAVFSNKLTVGQIAWLNRTNRTKVIIPDRYGDGHLLAHQAIQQGWSVSCPDIGDCKDVNEAVSRYGLLYVLKTIREHTCSGFEAEVNVGIYCEHGSRTSTKLHSKASTKSNH